MEKLQDFTPVPSLLTAYECGFVSNYNYGDMDITLIPTAFLKNVKEPYILPAKGNSMTPTIQDGDLLIVDHGVEAKHRDIVVARLNDQFVVKEYVENNFSTYLKSHNEKFAIRKIIEGEEFKVLGKVVGCFHFL